MPGRIAATNAHRCRRRPDARSVACDHGVERRRELIFCRTHVAQDAERCFRSVASRAVHLAHALRRLLEPHTRRGVRLLHRAVREGERACSLRWLTPLYRGHRQHLPSGRSHDDVPSCRRGRRVRGSPAAVLAADRRRRRLPRNAEDAQLSRAPPRSTLLLAAPLLPAPPRTRSRGMTRTDDGGRASSAPAETSAGVAGRSEPPRCLWLTPRTSEITESPEDQCRRTEASAQCR